MLTVGPVNTGSLGSLLSQLAGMGFGEGVRATAASRDMRGALEEVALVEAEEAKAHLNVIGRLDFRIARARTLVAVGEETAREITPKETGLEITHLKRSLDSARREEAYRADLPFFGDLLEEALKPDPEDISSEYRILRRWARARMVTQPLIGAVYSYLAALWVARESHRLAVVSFSHAGTLFLRGDLPGWSLHSYLKGLDLCLPTDRDYYLLCCKLRAVLKEMGRAHSSIPVARLRRDFAQGAMESRKSRDRTEREIERQLWQARVSLEGRGNEGDLLEAARLTLSAAAGLSRVECFLEARDHLESGLRLLSGLYNRPELAEL